MDSKRQPILRELDTDEAEQAKIENIIEMAFGFSAMTRVFRKGSSKAIKEELRRVLPMLARADSESHFRQLHHDFCQWFFENIRTASRERGSRVVKTSSTASYGQGAKVLDIALKVYVYYCQLPNPRSAQRTVKWLHAAIDTKMLSYLKKLPHLAAPIRATTIEQVDSTTYATLQATVRTDADRLSILPVQWDNVFWRRLNRKRM